MKGDPFQTEIARHVWDTKYRLHDSAGVTEVDIEDSWRRIAVALGAVETRDGEHWTQRFVDILRGFRFLPGGRIQAGAGSGQRVTLFNCFVMGTIEDSLDGIFDALKEGALTMQQGGGVGYDFSTLRPRGERAQQVGMVASGPVSFMRIWDSMCNTILSTGARRGAMMATLRCDHPDIEDFVDAKRDARELRHFNLSVLVSDALMEAVRRDEDWPLVFPLRSDESASGAETLERVWSGQSGPRPCRVYRRIAARGLWDRIMRATYDYAEPGVIFIDRVNAWNNLGDFEHISASNPCGEIPLPPYGACDLGSINLTQFVQGPFTAQAELDWTGIEATAAVATRLLDNVIDASRFPLERQREAAHRARRIGLGITGLADVLVMLGIRYGTAASTQLAADIMRCICHAAYRASVALAREKGAFPLFDRKRFLARPFVRGLPEEIRDSIARDGIRNSHLTAIAPTGTISLLANNVSSGLEPIFRARYQRQLREADGGLKVHVVEDYACRRYREWSGRDELPSHFVDVNAIDAQAHLDMQAALQPYVDNAISKTINVPVDYPYTDFRALYHYAYEHGLKGCTTFRPNPISGAVLSELEAQTNASHCCSVEREAD